MMVDSYSILQTTLRIQCDSFRYDGLFCFCFLQRLSVPHSHRPSTTHAPVQYHYFKMVYPYQPPVQYGATTNKEPPSADGVVDCRDTDVLSGRGGGTTAHPGNIYFRELIESYRSTYDNTSTRNKPHVSRHIVREVRKSGRRFLRNDNKDGLFYEIGDDAAREKISQTLRHRTVERRGKNAQNIQEEVQEQLKKKIDDPPPLQAPFQAGGGDHDDQPRRLQESNNNSSRRPVPETSTSADIDRSSSASSSSSSRKNEGTSSSRAPIFLGGSSAYYYYAAGGAGARSIDAAGSVPTRRNNATTSGTTSGSNHVGSTIRTNPTPTVPRLDQVQLHQQQFVFRRRQEEELLLLHRRQQEQQLFEYQSMVRRERERTLRLLSLDDNARRMLWLQCQQAQQQPQNDQRTYIVPREQEGERELQQRILEERRGGVVVGRMDSSATSCPRPDASNSSSFLGGAGDRAAASAPPAIPPAGKKRGPRSKPVIPIGSITTEMINDRIQFGSSRLYAHLHLYKTKYNEHTAIPRETEQRRQALLELVQKVKEKQQSGGYLFPIARVDHSQQRNDCSSPSSLI
jgi:hypothetical protein